MSEGRNVVFLSGKQGWHEKHYGSALLAHVAAFFWVLLGPFSRSAIVEYD